MGDEVTCRITSTYSFYSLSSHFSLKEMLRGHEFIYKLGILRSYGIIPVSVDMDEWKENCMFVCISKNLFVLVNIFRNTEKGNRYMQV